MVTVNRLVTRFNAISTDLKPILGMRNGDSLYIMDTQQLFMFDEENHVWHELPFDPYSPDKDSDVVGRGQVGYMKLAS